MELARRSTCAFGLCLLLATLARAQSETDADPFAGLPGYRFGESRAALAAIEEQVRHAGDQGAEIQARLLQVLQSPDATLEARRFCCRMLTIVGDEDCVPVLIELLDKPSLSEPARRALHTMPGPTVDAALLRAAQRASPLRRVALLQTLGTRRQTDATEWIETQLAGDDDLVRRAALWSLGQIGGVTAVLALESAELPDRLHQDRDLALLRCAERWIAAGERRLAGSVLEKLAQPPHHLRIQAAARRALVAADPEHAVARVLALLREDGPEWQAAAVSAIAHLQGPGDGQRLADALPDLPPAAAAHLIIALADRGDLTTAAAVATQLERPSPIVQNAALQALARLGGAAEVPPIAAFAARQESTDAVAATLAALRGPQVDDALLGALTGAPARTQIALIRALGQRRCSRAASTLLALAAADDPAVRRAAREALTPLVGEPELMLLGLMIPRAANQEERDALLALQIVALRRCPEDKRQGVLGGVAPDGWSRAALMQVRGQFPCDESFAVLSRAASEESDPAIRDAALRALAAWPDPDAFPFLRDGLEAVQDPAVRVEVLDGLLRLAAVAPELDATGRQELFQRHMLQAASDDERRVLLQRAAPIGEPWVLAFLRRHRDSPTLGKVAAPLLEDHRNAMARSVSHDASGRPVVLKQPCSEKYTGGGDGALTDDQYGSVEFHDGHWQGFEGTNLFATVDLGEPRTVTEVRVGFLQDHNSWIFAPLTVEFLVSSDGKKFRRAGSWSHELPDHAEAARVFEVRVSMNEADVTHVRVRALAVGTCPPWHPGAGKVAWLFVDELQVNPHLRNGP